LARLLLNHRGGLPTGGDLRPHTGQVCPREHWVHLAVARPGLQALAYAVPLA
jgi:hypothetical protein